MAVCTVNQKGELIAELTGIARAERAREDAQAFADFPLVGTRNCCAGVLRIRKFGGEIYERAATKLWICDLSGDALKQSFDLPAGRANMELYRVIPPPPEPTILLLGKGRD